MHKHDNLNTGNPCTICGEIHNLKEDDTIDPEVVHEETALARPSMPMTIDELAVIPNDQAKQIIDTRYDIICLLQRRSISLTAPQDWLLFKTPEGAVTAFLQESGCKRIWHIWGIEIDPSAEWEKIKDDETGDYAYKCFGNGVCAVTGMSVKHIEGVRYSNENYCKDLPRLQQEVRVKQAAMANRDGNIIRALTGLKSVALEMLEEVWKGSGKTSALCNLGKGYGSRTERRGAEVHDQAPKDVTPPICDICGKNMKYIAASDRYKAFWSCPDKKKGPDGKYNNHGSVEADKWEATMKLAAEDRAAAKGVA
jgi:hypothetical protein